MSRRFEGNPPPQADRIACSACGFPNDPKTRPHGGEFHAIVLTKTLAGETAYYSGDGPQGCAFCGSPAWMSGASLGDMAGWFRRKH